MSKCKTQVYRIYDGSADWLVRGTCDVEEATRILLDDGEVYDVEDGWAEDCDLEPVVTVERAGLFRMNPDSSGEYGWMLGFANKRGRGVFEGVYMDIRFEEVEYDCD